MTKQEIKKMVHEAKINKLFNVHFERMEKRALQGMLEETEWDTNFQPTENILSIVAYSLYKYLQQAEVKCGIVKRIDPGYFNDTFFFDGREWFEDISAVVKRVRLFNNDFRLILMLDEKNRIVLDQIEVYKKGTGLGSLIIDELLNVIDNLGLECYVVPTAIEAPEDKIINSKNAVLIHQDMVKRTNRLRKYYESFGFRSQPFTAKMVYKG